MPKHKQYLFIFVLLFFLSIVTSAFGVEKSFEGEGSAAITSDAAEVQYKAKKEATISALKMALQRILGPDSLNDQRVQQRMNDIFSQSSVYKVKQTFSTHREGNNYVVTTVLVVDEAKLQQLISDMGIALNTATVRSSKILTIMDEYFSLPSDLKAVVPLREETVYSYDRDSKFKEREGTSKKDAEAKAVSNKDQRSSSVADREQSSGAVSAKQQASGSFSGRQQDSGSASARGGYSDGAGSAYGKINTDYASKGSVDAKASQKGSLDAKYDNKRSLDTKDDKKNSQDSASLKKTSYDHARSVDSSDSDHQFYKHVKEYQSKSAPDKQSLTLLALQDSFQAYDLKFLDNDLFKNQYFRNKKIVDQLADNPELANYAKAAQRDLQADYFAIGVSSIRYTGKSEQTGSYLCDGNVGIKVYSTHDGETIASGIESDEAFGNSPDQCRAIVAKKIGKKLGDMIASKIQDSSKKRQIYGGEYTLYLLGNFPGSVKAQLSRRFNQIQGVTKATQRNADGDQLEFVINYNGQADGLVDSIFAEMEAIFKNYDYTIERNQISLFPVGEKGKIRK